jgi:hypothetical protein
MFIFGKPLQADVVLAALELHDELDGILKGQHLSSLAELLDIPEEERCQYLVEEVIAPEAAQDMPLIASWKFRAQCQRHPGEETAELTRIARDDVRSRFRYAFATLHTALADGTFIFGEEEGRHPAIPNNKDKAFALGERAGRTLTLIPPKHKEPWLPGMLERGASPDLMWLATVLYETGLKLGTAADEELWQTKPAEGLALSYQLTALAIGSFGCETACVPADNKAFHELTGLVELALKLGKDCRNLNDNYPFSNNDISARWALLASAFATFHLGTLIRYIAFGSERIGNNQALAGHWRSGTQKRLAVLNGLSRSDVILPAGCLACADPRLVVLETRLNPWLVSKKLAHQFMAAQVVLVAEALKQARMAQQAVQNFKGAAF